MNPKVAYKIFSSMLILSLLFSLVPLSANNVAKAQEHPEIFINYSRRGTEVVEVRLTNLSIDSNGNISGDMSIEAKTSLTYGFLFSVENGTVSGPGIEILLRATTSSIPLVGKRTLEVGRVTFSPGAHLSLRLDKVELVPGDAPMLLGLDLVTAFLLFTGVGYIPTKRAELLPSIAEAFTELLNNIGFDTALFADQLRREDYLGALRTLASMFVSAPSLFSQFLFSEYGISVAPDVVQDFGIRIGRVLPVIGVIPLVQDLIQRPRSAQVDISASGPIDTQVDVFMLVDLSGSFADDLPVFKSQAPEIISSMRSSNNNIRFGLGKFEDYPISPFGSASYGDKAYERLVDLTFDTNLVNNVISGLSTRSGGDGPQSQLPALYQTATGAGQNLSGLGYPEASIPTGQQANFRGQATKLILLWTDAPFHFPGDPGAIPYPGPSFDDTVRAILALDPPKVIGISSGGDGIGDLEAIAAATNAVAPPEGVDCDSDGVIDIVGGGPLVCSIAPSGEGVGNAISALVEAGGEVPVQDVKIDIKPGGFPNTIRCTNENAIITVAILTSDDFDATTINHISVVFENALETHIKKATGRPIRHEKDVDRDGDLDLVFHFRLGATGLTCNSTEATLIGETYNGEFIQGVDSLRMIP